MCIVLWQWMMNDEWFSTCLFILYEKTSNFKDNYLHVLDCKVLPKLQFYNKRIVIVINNLNLKYH